jgi:hypothetical protein
MGIGASRVDERILATTGLLPQASTQFEAHNNVMNAGVLFSLPALISQGLLKSKEIYSPLKAGYYGFVQIVLLLCFMALSRIKNPEQLKNQPPGEWGKILGLDRIPEVNCVREKLSQIVKQGKAEKFGRLLSEGWITSEKCLYFYVDGHVRIYFGNKAKLTKKFVSRQKLCLAGTTEFWVNDQVGIPIMFVIGDFERLKDAIEKYIVPALLQDTKNIVDEQALKNDPQKPRFVLIFDREAYEPAFFAMLWNEYRIAVITYRKNVKDEWDEKEFKLAETKILENNVSMLICEKNITLANHQFREIRKLSENGHQTSILCSHNTLSSIEAAIKMFARWSQENFFRYLIYDFDFDKMVEYGVESITGDIHVVNPEYTKLSSQIKKLREKKARVDAKLFAIIEENLDAPVECFGEIIEKQTRWKEKQKELECSIKQAVELRKSVPSRIALKDMPENIKYNRLKKESKIFMNIIKMISYRAETALFNIIKPFYKNADKDGRQLIKDIFTADADMIPDYVNNTLTVQLHSLSTPRANRVVHQLCKLLNDTETFYPNTNLKLVYKTLPTFTRDGDS